MACDECTRNPSLRIDFIWIPLSIGTENVILTVIRLSVMLEGRTMERLLTLSLGTTTFAIKITVMVSQSRNFLVLREESIKKDLDS